MWGSWKYPSALLLLGMAVYAVIAAAFIYPSMDTVFNAFITLVIAAIFVVAFLANVFYPQPEENVAPPASPEDEEIDLFE